MNQFFITGRVYKVPVTNILSITGNDGKKINMCNFIIAINDGNNNDVDDNNKRDFIQCVCLNELALSFSKNFCEGAKISCSGKLKNYSFADSNRTKHFTHYLLVTQFEFGDSQNSLSDKGSSDFLFLSDSKNDLKLLAAANDNGYLCIDESDYYRLAMDSFFSGR